MSSIITPNKTLVTKDNPLTAKTEEDVLNEALNRLDLQGTLVLMTLLSQRALWLQQEDLKKNAKVTKILTTS